MLDPVVASDGHTYEHSAVAEWLSMSAVPVSPVTGQVREGFPCRSTRPRARGAARGRAAACACCACTAICARRAVLAPPSFPHPTHPPTPPCPALLPQPMPNKWLTPNVGLKAAIEAAIRQADDQAGMVREDGVVRGGGGPPLQPHVQHHLGLGLL